MYCQLLLTQYLNSGNTISKVLLSYLKTKIFSCHTQGWDLSQCGPRLGPLFWQKILLGGPLAGSGLEPNPIQPYFDFLIDAHLTCGSRSSAILDRKVLLILLPFTFKLPLSTFFPLLPIQQSFPKNFFPSMSPCVVYQNYFQRRERGVVWKIAHSPRFFLLL